MNQTGLLFLSFGRALFLTIIIELFVAFCFGVRRKKEVFVVVCVNTLTNPVVMLYYTIMISVFRGFPKLLVPIPMELAAIVTEAMIYRSFGRTEGVEFRHPVALAVVANLISWGTGVILQGGGVWQ